MLAHNSLLLVIILILICKCISAEDILQAQTYIVGGSKASPGQFPYMVSLRSYGSHFCGGSLINDRWILTAAHCLVGFKTVDGMEAVFGTTSVKTGGVTIKVERIVPHEGFLNLFNFFVKNDIALVKIAKPVTFSNTIKPIALCTKQPSTGSWAVITGWGFSHMNDKVQDDLQFINYRFVGWFLCFLKQLPNILWFRYVCAQSTLTMGVCFGDSGGPLVVGDEQVGVLSWSTGCASSRPDAYASVCGFRQWINNYVD